MWPIIIQGKINYYSQYCTFTYITERASRLI